MRHTKEMGEISGFGGGYEECCQVMLETGVKWLEEHPNANLEVHGYEGVYGVLEADSDDANELSDNIIKAAKDYGGATGAMHEAVMTRLLFIHENGWDTYCEELRKHKEDDSV